MSRIGKKPVSLPQGVTASVSGQTVTAKGPKGELKFVVNDEVLVKLEDGQIAVAPRDESKTARSKWGMSRTQIVNILQGVKNGFEKKLEITGAPAGVTVTVRFAPLPPKTMLPVGTSKGFAAEPLRDKFAAGVFASPTVKGFAAVGVPSDVLWLARVEIVGAVLVPVTVSTNVSVTLFGPSFTVTVMVLVPLMLAAGVTVTVRFEPVPPKTILPTGTSAGFDELALNCKFAAATCASLMANGMAAVGTFRVVV